MTWWAIPSRRSLNSRRERVLSALIVFSMASFLCLASRSPAPWQHAMVAACAHTDVWGVAML